MRLVRKLIPVSLYDIPGLEAWLEDQANRGLFPTHLGFWATFEDTGVPGTRFRLAARERKEVTPSFEQLELCRQYGWNYALSFGGFFLFYAVDPDAIELYTDWESRGFSLNPLKKRMATYQLTTMIFYGILVALVVWALFFYESKFDIQPDHFTVLPLILLNAATPVILCYLVELFLLWRDWRRNYRALRKAHAALSQGLPPPSSPGPRRNISREKGLALILLIPLILFFVVNKLDILNPFLNIPLDHFTRAYVTLQELEQEPVYPSEEVFEEHSVFDEPENYAEVNFSLLSPVWYSVTQEGYSPTPGTMENANSPDPEGGKYRYAPDLDMTYFSLIIPALAEPVARAQLDEYRLVNLWWEYEEISYPGLDFVILATAQDEPWQMAALGKGSQVAVFRYAGVERLEDHLDVLFAMTAH